MIIHANGDLRFSVAWKTDRGPERSSNEDAVIVDTSLGLFAVADGMGGHKAGGTASSIAVYTLHELVKQGRTAGSDAMAVLHEAILGAHGAVLAAAQDNSDCEEMGTTLVVALFTHQDSFVIGHVGDSRAYLIGHNSIEALTQDHTFLAEWIQAGSISLADARTHPARHGLFMALGVDDEIEPELRSVLWPVNARLLLCSDGLTDALDEQDMLRIVQESNTLEAACEDLVAFANERGGRDNVTVVLIGIGSGRDRMISGRVIRDLDPCQNASTNGLHARALRKR